MIYQIFNRLIVKICPKSISIKGIDFNNHQEEIQVKIIEIIYIYLKPKKNFLRYKKIANLLINFNKRKLIRANLAGMTIKKGDYFITFST